MEQVEILKSNGKGVILFVKGYEYALNSTQSNTKYWKCNRCSSRLKTPLEVPKEIPLEMIKEHYHQPCFIYKNVRKLIQDIKEAAKAAPHRSPSEIIEGVFWNYSARIISLAPSKQSLSRMIRNQQNGLKPIAKKKISQTPKRLGTCSDFSKQDLISAIKNSLPNLETNRGCYAPNIAGFFDRLLRTVQAFENETAQTERVLKNYVESQRGAADSTEYVSVVSKILLVCRTSMII